MARSILLAGAVAWLLAGLSGLAIALVGTGTLERLLPPLSIDTDALRGAVIAVGVGLLGVGLVHVAVVIGLSHGKRWGWSAAVLLAALLAATLVALGAAAATSAMTTPAMAPLLIGAGLAAALGALGYALAALRLVGERRSGSAH